MMDQESSDSDPCDALLRGFRLSEWAVEPLTSTFKRNGHTLHVEPKVMDVLLCLARNAGEVVTRDQLLEQVWANLVVTDEVLTRCISELRTALGDTSRERLYIRTVPKRGYSLMMPVSALDDTPKVADEQATGEPVALPETQSELQSEPRQQTEFRAKPANVAAGDISVAAAPATPWFAREIIGLLKSIVQGLAKVGVVTLAMIFTLFILLAAVTVLTESDVTASNNVDDGTNALDKIGERLERMFNAETETVTTATAEISATNDSEPLTVAVLPFINLSGDPDSDYFSNGLAEDIRNKLISTPELGIRVVARTSSEVFRNRAIDIREIGEQLNTRTLVEGTVRISGERVRVTVQVTKADDGFPRWAESFEYAMDDVLRIQAEIAEQVVQQLVPTLAPNLIAGWREQISVKAYDFYMLGRHHWDQRTPESLQKATGYFREALRLDDKFALAYSGLADSLVLSADYADADRKTAVSEATELVEKALTLNPELAEAHASQGLIYRVTGNIDAAKKEYQRAVDLNPNYSMARMWLANVLMDFNDVNAAFKHYQVAMQVDPLHPTVQQNYLQVLYAMGRDDEATKLADKYYAQSKSERLLKSRLHMLLAAGEYDKVLQFAVRHNFSDEYATYATQTVVEALIYLQRNAEAEALIEQNRQQFSGNQLATFRAQQAIAVRDADKLLMAAERMEASKEDQDHYKSCRSNYINHWRGVAASLNKDYVRANAFFKASLAQNDDDCMRDLIRRSTFHAYYAQSLINSGQESLAEDTLQQAWKELNFAMEHGRKGAEITFSKAGLFAAAGKYAEASAEVQTLLDNKWQFYGQLKHLPLFDDLEQQLASTNKELASQYESMQENCKDIKLTKFGV
ncbi:MAG: winged helix-turn-helix domain-containing protein [Pseudomonadales bacterium]